MPNIIDRSQDSSRQSWRRDRHLDALPPATNPRFNNGADVWIRKEHPLTKQEIPPAEAKLHSWCQTVLTPKRKACWIDAEDLLDEFNRDPSELVLIDLRNGDYEGGTIEGSVNVPAESFHHSQATLLNMIERGHFVKVIFYDGLSEEVASRCAGCFLDLVKGTMATSSIEVFILDGGIQGWSRKGEDYVKRVVGYEEGYWKQSAIYTGFKTDKGMEKAVDDASSYTRDERHTISVASGPSNGLAGLSFVLTGTPNPLSREDCRTLIRRFGGHVSKMPDPNTSYIVLGEDTKVKKLEKIRKENMRTIDVTGLFELIRHRSIN